MRLLELCPLASLKPLPQQARLLHKVREPLRQVRPATVRLRPAVYYASLRPGNQQLVHGIALPFSISHQRSLTLFDT